MKTALRQHVGGNVFEEIVCSVCEGREYQHFLVAGVQRCVTQKDVLVVDYVDSAVPVLARMAAKRRAGYRALGYVMK